MTEISFEQPIRPILGKLPRKAPGDATRYWRTATVTGADDPCSTVTLRDGTRISFVGLHHAAGSTS